MTGFQPLAAAGAGPSRLPALGGEASVGPLWGCSWCAATRASGRRLGQSQFGRTTRRGVVTATAPPMRQEPCRGRRVARVSVFTEYVRVLPVRIGFGSRRSEGWWPLIAVFVFLGWLFAGLPLGVYQDSVTLGAAVYLAAGIVVALGFDFLVWRVRA